MRANSLIASLGALALTACGAASSALDGGGGGEGGVVGTDGGGGDAAQPRPDLAGVDLAGADFSGGGACPVFPADNPWNTDISTAQVDPMSDAYIASIGAAVGLHNDFDSIGDGIPFVVVPGNQAKVPITFGATPPPESDVGPYAIPDNAPIEMGGDGHVIAVDLTNCFLYELYRAAKIPGGWSADSGAIFDLSSNKLRPDTYTSADAAGLPIYAGLVRYDEVQAGAINHALRFTVVNSQKGYIHPATHAAGSCAINSACPPMGMRVRLKASVSVSGYPASVQVILTALKKYGMMVADNGGRNGNWFISGEPNVSWNDGDLANLKKIVGSDFEVIATGPITPYP